MRSAIRGRAQAGIGRSVLDTVGLGMLDAVRGDRQRSLARAELSAGSGAMRELAPVDRPYFQLATLFALSGRADRARAVLRAREQEFKDTARLRSQQPRLHAVLGEIALAEGRGRDAVSEFWKSDSASDGPSTSCLRCVYAWVARGYDMAGMSDSAIAYLNLYLATPDAGAALSVLVSPDPQFLGPALERLGQLYEAKGNTERAAEYFGKFVSLWEHADPVAQPRVAEARRRMQKLRPVEKAKP